MADQPIDRHPDFLREQHRYDNMLPHEEREEQPGIDLDELASVNTNTLFRLHPKKVRDEVSEKEYRLLLIGEELDKPEYLEQVLKSNILFETVNYYRDSVAQPRLERRNSLLNEVFQGMANTFSECYKTK